MVLLNLSQASQAEGYMQAWNTDRRFFESPSEKR